MTTYADALEVMTIVAACHHRTAPRLDDREAALATAEVWAELFSAYDFGVDELVAAVKARAKTFPDAPEPADIIRVARAARRERIERWQTEPDRDIDPGDAKAAPDPADYPSDWDSDQRVAAYWFALRMHAIPHTTAGWVAIAKQLAAEQAHREAQKADL